MTSAHAGLVLDHIRRLGGPADAQLLQRFTAHRDEAAFALLVRRHGPMVLNVCRAVLHNEQDAEDAFQATFLILARKAASVRRPEAIAGWLHEVAHRVALKAQACANRRRAREGQVTPMTPADPTLDMTLRDLHRVLHEELHRLPDLYRLPLVLCYLEGRSQEEAARQLGWSKGAFRGRLDRAREMLRRRLVARRVTLSALLCATAVTPRSAAEALLGSAVAAALQGASSGALSARATVLAEGVVRAMSTSKPRIAAVLLFLAGLVAGVAALARESLLARQPPAQSQKPTVKPTTPPVAEEKADHVEVTGRVLDPAGKTVGGAKVYFARYILRHPASEPSDTTTSDARGLFRLRVSRTGYPEPYMKARWMQGAVVAVGKGFAAGWVGADNAEKLKNVTIQLGRDVSISGRVVNLEGKPIAGVSVQVLGVRVRQDGGDLKDLVASLQKEQPNAPHHPEIWLHPGPLGLTRATVTGTDGKFRVTGIRGECVVQVRFAGPSIEAAEVLAMTRPCPTLVTNRRKSMSRLRNVVFHGNTFDHAAAPTRPIEGVVRDQSTGKPLAGATVRARMGPPGVAHFVGDPSLEATTDAEGRYRLVGLTREAGHRVEVLSAPGQPYLRAARESKAAPGLGPMTMDFTLKRGVLIRGRVTDKETGRPVPALVRYLAFFNNPHLKEAPGFAESEAIEVRTTRDGSFTLLGLPGQGLIAAKTADRQEGRYLMAFGADKIKGLRFDNNFDTVPSVCNIHSFNTLVEVNPARDAQSIVCDVILDPGKAVTGTILDPDGKPLTGAEIDSVFGVWYKVKDLPTASFRIPGIDEKHPRSFWFRHRKKNLGAIVLFKGTEAMPVTVRLQKCATITCRFVDEDGNPRPGWIMGYVHKGQLNINSGVGCFAEGSGKTGHFRIEGVIPGLKIGMWAGNNPSTYDQHIVPELTLKPGEVKDLGDVKRK
jgi:RNA polymerase sigma factor (sigma-70 family)